MRILIAHFHLQTGGVTRVIEHACAALAARGHRVLVVAGEAPQLPLPKGVSFADVPGLAYEERRPALSADELAAALARTARDHFGDLPDLWHVHNHCLGKNLALPQALLTLARQGNHLLLQPHDFAEDGRPQLYARLLEELGGGDIARLSSRLYPQAEHIHYAVLNHRDREFLAAAGVAGARLHLLPNAVSLPTKSAHPDLRLADRRLWLYPTRAIRRKNLGELLLWAAAADDENLFATTQAPRSPAEQTYYRHWVGLAQELELPVEFALGARMHDFPALLASAHALITTSVAEGFGLAFLEPWLAGRPLAGRDLPEVTKDFVAAGLELGALYGRLEVPLDWLDAKRLRGYMEQALGVVMGAYGRERTLADLEWLWSSVVQENHIDFGRLDEAAQTEVIRHLAGAKEDRTHLRPQQLSDAAPAELVARNRGVVERQYSISGYGDRLEGIYRSLLNAPTSTAIDAADGRSLLDRFLAPERLYLLRT